MTQIRWRRRQARQRRRRWRPPRGVPLPPLPPPPGQRRARPARCADPATAAERRRWPLRRPASPRPRPGGGRRLRMLRGLKRVTGGGSTASRFATFVRPAPASTPSPLPANFSSARQRCRSGRRPSTSSASTESSWGRGSGGWRGGGYPLVDSGVAAAAAAPTRPRPTQMVSPLRATALPREMRTRGWGPAAVPSALGQQEVASGCSTNNIIMRLNPKRCRLCCEEGADGAVRFLTQAHLQFLACTCVASILQRQCTPLGAGCGPPPSAAPATRHPRYSL